MNISLQKLLTLAGIIAISIFSFAAKKAEPVNGECPFSGKAVKADKVLTFNVCCNNCVKKASSDNDGFQPRCSYAGKLLNENELPAKRNNRSPNFWVMGS